MPVPPGIMSQFQQAMAARRYAQARLLAERCVQLEPSDATPHDMLRCALAGLGLHADAILPARRVTELLPQHIGGWTALGTMLAMSGHKAESIEPFERAVALDPTDVANTIELATAYMNAGRLTQAESLCRAAITTFGPRQEFIFRLMGSLCEQGRTDEACEVLSSALFQNPTNEEIAVSLCCTSVYAGKLSAHATFQYHLNFGRMVAPQNPADVFRHDRPKPGKSPAGVSLPGRGVGGRVRVAFISSDFRSHSVARFAEPAIARLDRAMFEPLCISTVAVEDTFTGRIKRALGQGEWRKAPGLDPRSLAEFIRRQRVDVLIDLNGLTFGGIWATLALRPAPVQITYCGYPHTTGINTVGYRIVDAITDPPGLADKACIEKLLRIAPCFLCYQPAEGDESLPPREPFAGNRLIVFGSFNRLVKVSEQCLRAWAEILKRVPPSRLLIKSATLIDPHVAARFNERLAALGIDPARVTVRTKTPGLREHMLQYHDVDIALDTFPYAGTTTTCEALFMGVPVITLARPWEHGGSHAERVGASLITNASHTDLIAQSESDYIRIAADLATNPARLAELQSTARTKLLASPLCDQVAFGRAFSGGVLHAWNDWCATPSAPT